MSTGDPGGSDREHGSEHGPRPGDVPPGAGRRGNSQPGDASRGDATPGDATPGDASRGDARHAPYDRFADLPPIDIEIPDDLSELDEDIRRYHQEQRIDRLRLRALRILFTRRWNAYGLSGPLVVAILLVVALVGALAVLLTPRDPPRRAPVPLSTRAAAAPGRPGGLLPTGQVRISGVAIDLRSLRPAVLALVPPACSCEKELDELFVQATSYSLDLLLVSVGGPGAGGQTAPTASVKQFRALTARVGNGSAQTAEDSEGALVKAYQPRGLTIVLVQADGVVSAVHRDLRDLKRLQLDLARLQHPVTTD